MFSNKNSVTKEEVQEMINKSNQSTVQWITVLEQKNKYLEQQNAELNKYILNLQVKFDETNKFLEKRITDFTDIWHPMMMQNINRIKDELVKSIKKSNDTEVENKLAILNNKIESIQLNNLKSKIDEISKQLLETLDNINPNIKLKYGSLETYNGIPIRKYIELFF